MKHENIPLPSILSPRGEEKWFRSSLPGERRRGLDALPFEKGVA